jgi:hypothetical protein
LGAILSLNRRGKVGGGTVVPRCFCGSVDGPQCELGCLSAQLHERHFGVAYLVLTITRPVACNLYVVEAANHADQISA